MSTSLRKQTSSTPAKFDPFKTKERISEVASVKKHADRMRNPEMFERSLEFYISEISAFKAWWKEYVTVNHGVGRGNKKNAARHSFSVDEAEKETGIKQEQVSRWGKLLRDIDRWRAAEWAAFQKRNIDQTANTTATKWTGDPESYTPEQYITAARFVMGGIDLDPASDAVAQKTVQALTWYSVKDDGLKQPWAGRVFLNPPYAYPTVADFIARLLGGLENYAVSQAILLTNNNTDTRWWHDAAKRATGVCFTAGRINFYKADGSMTQPTNGQTFFYFGPEAGRFITTFSQFGLVMEVMRDDSLS